jgi:aconitate hydratase
MPAAYLVDDSMFIFPRDVDRHAAIERGPNIGEPPRSSPLPDSISGEVTIKVGDKITTDAIIPAGARMKYRSNVPKYSEYLFENVDPKFFERARTVKDRGKHNIIVAGVSYGQGSSREHAALCPMYMAVRAVIAKSFERIHSANLVNFGILPLTFRTESDYDRVAQGDEVDIPGVREALGKGGRLVAHDRTRGFDFELSCELSDRQREIVLAGGTLSFLTAR